MPTEYVILAKLILIPLGVVISTFLLERWIKKIVDLFRKTEEMIVAWNKSAILLLCLYYICLAYAKLT